MLSVEEVRIQTPSCTMSVCVFPFLHQQRVLSEKLSLCRFNFTSLVISQESFNISFFVDCLITTFVYFSVGLLSFTYTHMPAPGQKPMCDFPGPTVGNGKGFNWAVVTGDSCPHYIRCTGCAWQSLKEFSLRPPWPAVLVKVSTCLDQEPSFGSLFI